MKKSARGVAGEKAPSVYSLGISLDVSGSALIDQAKERIAWHKRQAASMTAELRAMPPSASTPSLSGSLKQDMRRADLERFISGHEEHARFLAFVARTLIRTRTYRVSLQDLSHLEIMPKGSYV